ncbi:MAG: DNA-protecting protein DprA [Helicobacteraceae bacterium]|nr:DNA-protecting protein DprA [Helicobacteraceae bacterium]
MIEKLSKIPENLLTIKEPPKEIFYEGNLSLLEKKLVAIIGSRRASNYAKTYTKIIASAISKAGAAVVSGGAYGIDENAHEAAGENTIAILAGSIDRDKRKLIDKIKENALVLSEYERDIEPKNWSFVHRNRLITGIADIVCVTEAELNSGSHASINRALDQKKDIYVIPHRLGESEATNKLLRENKAKIIWDENTLLKALNLELKANEKDEILIYAKTRPIYDDAIEKFGAKIYEYELEGKIVVTNGRIEVGDFSN